MTVTLALGDGKCSQCYLRVMPDRFFKLALLGHPVGHSLSPSIHDAGLVAIGCLPGYVAIDVSPGDLKDFVGSMVRKGFDGANVTIPHKEAVVPLMDSLSPAAERIGAVNTIVVKDGRLHGDNTDHIGFIRPLQQFGEGFRSDRALVLGAGGAARAVLYALGMSPQAKTIVLTARQSSRCQRLLEALAMKDVSIVDWDARFKAAPTADLIVNTTPVGLWPRHEASPLAGCSFSTSQTVYDLVYNPGETQLLHDARSAGARIQPGLPMLIEQAAESFFQWTGHELDRDAVRVALGPVLRSSTSA
ncbi:MAG: shikimate dehydrogenase [Rhodothermales bacterium]|jgi:shikimate dehydrogenase